MRLFSISKNKLEKIREIPFKNEKEIQSLTERSLKTIFNLVFVKSEFNLRNLRIDTLAFDEESKSFVIIEFKRSKNFSVIDQGFTYLALLLKNKADVILEYNELMDKKLKRDDVDWSQSKVIFVSSQFTNYQRQAINFKDLPIELVEVAKYENGTVSYNQLKSPEASESINTLIRTRDVFKNVSKEIKVYTEEDHLSNINDDVRELYEELKTRILNVGEGVEVKPKKLYIAFVAATNFVYVTVQRSQLKIWLNLNKGELEDPWKMARDVSNIGHWGYGDYEIVLTLGSDLDYFMTLVKQAYLKNK